MMDSIKPLTILSPIGYHSGSCGYCKDSSSSQRTPDSRGSYYAQAKSVSPTDYQTLLHRGWRRSGNLLYMPDARHSCCPHHMLRLPVKKFEASREHRRVIHRWNRFILGDDYEKEAVRLRPKSKKEKASQRNEFDFHQAIHAAERPKLPDAPKPKHHFEVTVEPNTFTEEKYLLYEKYQQEIHHEGPSEITRSGFKRFLCTSPINALFTPTSPGSTDDLATPVTDPDRRLGSYHACYRVDGALIAIAVLDFLPQGISSVYFCYHPDYAKWSLGKLSALREIAMTEEEGREYYYMGYIIWSCDKMRYKADYKPQEVMVWRTGEWRAIDGPSGRDEVGPNEEVDWKRTFETPVLAVEALEKTDISLFDVDFPGMMEPDAVLDEIELEEIKIRVPFEGRAIVVTAQDLSAWDDTHMFDRSCLKGIIAELAACVGTEVAMNMIVDFSSG